MENGRSAEYVWQDGLPRGVVHNAQKEGPKQAEYNSSSELISVIIGLTPDERVELLAMWKERKK